MSLINRIKADPTLRQVEIRVMARTSEMSVSGAPRYRAGLNFEDADPVAVEAFCTRHQA